VVAGPGQGEDLRKGVVVIATSAGGLSALRTVLQGLPSDFPLPVLVVQHISPDRPSSLAQILGHSTTMPVEEAKDDTVIEPGHVYIAAPDRHLVVEEGGCLRLTGGERVRFSRPSADVLFSSVAEVFGSSAIGVVLSGMGYDATEGAMRIKEAGGTVICSDEQTTEFFSMARTAIARGAVDAVLPLGSIAGRLVDAAGSGSNR
jgi:two-component system, chemotaxis family, protein-glutamate methylesterase/glutaminase